MTWTARTIGLIALAVLFSNCSGSSNPAGTAPAASGDSPRPPGAGPPGSTVSSQDVNLASVHGLKWSDADGNGARDPEEPGLPGVTIFVDLNDNGSLDDGEPMTTTMDDDPGTDFDETGQYWLEDLEPGVLVIREIVPDGFVQTFPNDPPTHVVDAAAGEMIENLDFGNQEIVPASIHGTKWSDANGDGVRDPDEPGLPGVTIYLDLNDNDVLDDGEPTATTMEDDPGTDLDETGRYWLEELDPGTYVVREVAPDGFMQTFPTSGEHEVILESGDIVEEIDFGNEEIVPASVHGLKWHDLNGDGVRDPDEPGLAGVIIYADFNADGELQDTEPQTTTMEDDPGTDFDETGQYWLEGLPPRTIAIREIVPDGFEQTFPDGPHVAELTSGAVIEELDFGNQETAGVGGRKWLDVDGDGTRNDGEPGLAGVTIYADLNDNQALDPDEPRTETIADDPDTDFDETGLYVLAGLSPGDLLIREVVPGGFIQTFPGDTGAHMVSVEMGGFADGLDFGNQQEGHKVTVCHKNRHTIEIDFHALPAHLNHGDWVVVDGAVCGDGS